MKNGIGNINVNNRQDSTDEGPAPAGAMQGRSHTEPSDADSGGTATPQGAAGSFSLTIDPFPHVENSIETMAKMNADGAVEEQMDQGLAH